VPGLARPRLQHKVCVRTLQADLMPARPPGSVTSTRADLKRVSVPVGLCACPA